MTYNYACDSYDPDQDEFNPDDFESDYWEVREPDLEQMELDFYYGE